MKELFDELSKGVSAVGATLKDDQAKKELSEAVSAIGDAITATVTEATDAIRSKGGSAPASASSTARRPTGLILSVPPSTVPRTRLLWTVHFARHESATISRNVWRWASASCAIASADGSMRRRRATRSWSPNAGAPSPGWFPRPVRGDSRHRPSAGS